MPSRVGPKPITASVGWGPRAEWDLAWAQTTTRTLEAVQVVFPEITNWYGSGVSLRDALSRPLQATTVDVVGNSVPAGYTDDGAGQDDGVTFQVWDGRDPGVSVYVLVGSTRAGMDLVNRVVVSFQPSDSRRSVRDDARAVLSSLVELWDPDRGMVTPYRFSPFTDEAMADVYQSWVGWLTYVPPSGPPDGLPSWCEVERLDNGGALVVAAEDVRSLSAEQLREVVRALSR